MLWIVGGVLLVAGLSLILFTMSLFGNSVQVVDSEVVVVRPQPSAYQPGQVIVFKSRTSDTIISGYIVAVEANGVYRTQRAADDTSDTQLVQEDRILGKKLLAIPVVGWVATQVKTIVAAAAGGVSAVWQSLFGSEQPVMVITPAGPAGEQTGSPSGSGMAPADTGVIATPTAVVATPTPKPTANVMPTSSPAVVTTPQASSTPVSVSQEEINAGFLTLPAPSETP